MDITIKHFSSNNPTIMNKFRALSLSVTLSSIRVRWFESTLCHFGLEVTK